MENTDILSMSSNISAIEGSGQADTLQGAVQASLLKKSLEMEKSQTLSLLPKTGNTAIGNHVDVMA